MINKRFARDHLFKFMNSIKCKNCPNQEFCIDLHLRKMQRFKNKYKKSE